MKMNKSLAVVIGTFLSFSFYAQNVGINATGTNPDASAMLDIVSTNKGLLVPRVSLTATNAAGPIAAPTTSLLVYNTATAGTAPNNVTPGYYFWDGTTWQRFDSGNNIRDWKITGNAGTIGGNTTTAGTNFLGTTDAQNLCFRTNGVERGRFSTSGEFFINTLNTATAGDLMGVVSNATFPWAINGYSGVNGGGVYGQITGGTTVFAGVQGEYSGTGGTGAGVRGIYLTTLTGGTGFNNAVASGVNGTATSSGNYKFGVFGSGGTNSRSGGVLGNDYGFALGALGYYTSGLVDIAVYGFGQAHTNGVAGGRLSGALTSNWDGVQNTTIGLGIYGGVMGGWVRGLAYGMHVKGEQYSMYVDGLTFTNKPIAQLVNNGSEERVPCYSSTSFTSDIYERGKSNLINGEVFIPFSDNFRKIISNPEEVVITVTPNGNSNGVYISKVDADGFFVKENNHGTSNVKLTWIAVSTIKGNENISVDKEILSSGFDAKMDGVMFNDNNTTDKPQSIWWDGQKVRFDTPPIREKKSENTFSRQNSSPKD